MSETLQSLEDLVASKGWAWVMDTYEAHWGAQRFLERLEQIERDSTLSDTERRWHAQQAWAGKRAIDGFLRMPHDEIAKARRAYQAPESSPSRRGPGM